MPASLPLLAVEELQTYFYTRRGVVKAVDGVSFVTVQVMKTGLTPPLAPSDHLREAEKEQLHPAEQLHTRR
jgi:hypothetical protein